MALGHALLHPERVRRALDADASADAYGATMDGALGLFGFGDPGPAAAAWVEGIRRRAEPLMESAARIGREGPFAAFLQTPAPDIPGLMAQLGGLLESIATLDADTLRLRLNAVLDIAFSIVPDLRLPDLAGMLNTEMNAALGILEAPLVGGRRDAAAHRAFRTAAEIRRRLRDLSNPLPPAFAGIELKALLRGRITALLGTLEAPALAALGTQIGALKTEFGGLFDALGRVSVRVEVQAGGPQPMAGPTPTLADEVKVTPFPPGHALWWLDLITGIVAVFNLIWEMVRTSNFSRGARGFDGFCSVLVMLWQVARVTTRAAAPGDMSEWPRGTQWLFTDQGDFVLSFAARFLAAFADAGAATNWVGSVLIRGLKQVTAVSQPRFIYQFARSIWYFDEFTRAHDAWKNTPGRREDDETDRPHPTFLRTTWIAWGPMWICGLFFGLMPSWDDFHIEGFPGSFLGTVIAGAVVAIIPCIALLVDQTRRSPPAEDHATHGVMTGVLVLVVILIAILVEGLESDDRGAAIGGLIAFAAVVGLSIFFSWLPQTASGGSFLLIAVTGLIAAYLIPYILWWDYIDDGRDKPGAFDGLNADTTPYRLPFTAGENWMCSQGTHGIFSHHTKDGTTNHYAFDFNEVEGSIVRAARDGIISELQEVHENRKQEANFLHVLHTTWVQGHDPGTDDERVITFANYFHLMQNGVLPVLGQSVTRGENIARLDSTGRSAQQHIHIAAEEQQRGEAQGLPFVFGDDDTKGFRHYPLLAWIGGKGKIAGKPVSYAFYKSSNTAPDGTLAPANLAMALGPEGLDDHMHRLVIPAAALAGTADPIVVFAEPQRGHTHRVTLTRAALAALRSASDWTDAGITVEAGPDGHTHPPLRRPLGTITVPLETAVSATAGTHRHDVSVDLATLLPGVAATTTLTSGNDRENKGRADPPPPRHTHPVVLTAAAIRSLLERDAPAAAEVTVQNADGHTHTPRGSLPLPGAQSLPELSAALVAPPHARLAIGTPGPYRLFGGQAILRINDTVSEAWLLGAHRPELHPDLPAERGCGAGEILRFDTTNIASTEDMRGSARLGAAALTRSLRASGGRLRHAALVPVPVIVIETRRRGSAARLRRTGGATLFGAGTGPESRGAGDLPDIGVVTRAALATHIASFLQNPWPAPPPLAIASAFQPGGPPLDLAPSAPRNAAVLAIAANPLDGAIASPQPLPLQPGLVGVTGGWFVPVLAAPAVLSLDLGHAAMTGAQRQATPLVVTVSGAAQPVVFTAADTDAAAVARRIMLLADGVRAWADGAATVIVSTVAGGVDASLALAKEAGLALGPATGASAPLSAGTTVRDSGAVTGALLHDVVLDGVTRRILPYTAATVQPTATVQGDRIRLAVAAGNTIRRGTEGVPLVVGTAAAALQWESDALPATLSLAGSSWMDVEVNATTVRVPLTGEPARIEIGPLPRMPANGDRLELEVDGAPLSIPFDGLEGSVAGVAARIAAASDAITVRFAYRLTVAGTLHGEANGPSPLRLSESQLLNVAGFLRDRAALVDAAIGPVGDALQAGPGGPIDDDAPTITWRQRGARSTRLTVPATDPPSLVAAAGDTLTVTPPTAGDPLGLTVNPPNTVATTAAFPVALPGDVATWSFVARQGGTDRTVATAQLAAMPAALRAGVAPEALPGGVLNLAVTVTAPDGARPPATVDLAGLANAEDAAARIAAVPGVVAFPVSVGATAADARIQIETLGRGTGWGLRLAGKDAILALGFRLPDFDPAADALEATGGGTVQDGAAVTMAEARAMLLRATQGAVEPAPNPPPLYAVSAPGGTDVLLAPGVAGGPAPSLASDPAGYAATLNATGAAAGLTIPGGTTRPLGAVLRVTSGAQRTTIRLVGSPAVLRSPNPVPADGTPEATAELAFLQANGVTIAVDGTAHAVPPAPGPFATVDDAVAWIAEAIAPGWAGLVSDPAPGTARHLALRSSRRGTDARAQLTFPAAGAPASGLLGFTATVSVNGTGTVRNADGITIVGGGGTLQRRFEDRAALADTPQTLFRALADDAAGTVSLVPNSTATVLAPPAGLPGSIAVAAQGGTILLTTGPAQVLDTHIVTIGVVTPGADPAMVSALLWGAPARLPAFTPPTSLAVLAGTALEFLVNDAPLTITLAAPASLDALAAQIARGSGWRLRAFQRAGALLVETVQDGKDAKLVLSGGSAVTDDPATGFTTPARPLEARGAGSVGDLARATPTAIGAALEAGWLDAGGALDGREVGRQEMDRREYDPLSVAGNAWVLGSQRAGIPGRLEWLARHVVPGEPAWDESLGRGAAIHAAVALPAIAGTVSPNGALVIRLDDNSGPGLPSAREVTVNFDGGALDAAGVATRINAALRTAGAGAAGAWPDGTVVVETAHPGLAGTLEIPAPGDRGIADALVGAGVTLRARGWPGGGRAAAFQPMPQGWRAVRATAEAPLTTYEFRADGRSTGPVAMAVGMDADAAALALNAGFDTTAGGGTLRIGLAAVVDGALCVEAVVTPMTLLVDGTVSVPTKAGKAGETPEPATDGAFDLRPTELIRTLRLLRAATDDPAFGGAHDFGWLRHPMQRLDPVPPETDATIESANFPAFPVGRWLAAVRPDASRATNAADATALREATAMCVLARPASGPGSPASPLILRYWVTLSGRSDGLIGGSAAGGEPFMLDLLTWR